MKSQIQTNQRQGEVIKLRTYPAQKRITLSESELRNLQADRWGWRTLRICGAVLCILIPLWLIGMTFSPKPAVLPNCQSNCDVDGGLF